MKSLLRAGLTLFAILSLLTGMAYPLLVTLATQVAFSRQANGTLVRSGEKLIGSELIGQTFDGPGYFWGRSSATSPVFYNAASSAGSNLSPSNPDLLKKVKERIEVIRKAHPNQTGPIPADLVTASASGLDPHISPAAAEYQIARVSKNRDMKEEQVRALVEEHTQGRTFGVLGEPRVNVLLLNVALDKVAEKKAIGL